MYCSKYMSTGQKNLGKAQFVLSQTMAAFAQKIFERNSVLELHRYAAMRNAVFSIFVINSTKPSAITSK